MTTIPGWNAQGVIPPVDPLDPTSADRSPYVVPLAGMVRRFATSPERIAILRGFLEYRAALHAAGMSEGLNLIFWSNYWSGMWSHQRETFLWKGLLQVSLSSDEDASALAVLPVSPGGATP